MAAFAPRTRFAIPPNLPRSYYLGHHASGLARMKSMLSSIDLILEVRDFRIPLTSRNPLLEAALGGSERRRIVVYTKRDLGAAAPQGRHAARVEDAVRAAAAAAAANNTPRNDDDGDNNVFFFSATGTGRARRHNAPALLGLIKAHARARFSLTGTRLLVAGMPNVGKSTLLNALRAAGGAARGRKVAATGGLPGVTRSVGGPVKILEGWEVDGERHDDGGGGVGDARRARSEPVYVHDTPGVFMPYVPSGAAMLKLALCGAVKEGLVPPVTLADYLLFRLNLVDPALYAGVLPAGAGPTNDVGALLRGVAARTGKLGRRGEADLESAAVWFVQRWRRGDVGRFLLDDVFGSDAELHDEAGAPAPLVDESGQLVSMSQARKADKERRRELARERRA